MSEGPEVRRTADRLNEALAGHRLVDVELRGRDRLSPTLRDRLVGAEVLGADAVGKHIIVAFEGDLWLHNHMMMFGKWRIYPRTEYEAGKAKPPPRSGRPGPRSGPTVTDVRKDSRLRLALAVPDTVAVEFNGPVLRFTDKDPRTDPAIVKLGPDALAPDFDVDEVLQRMAAKPDLRLAEAVLDQTIAAGVGNKYKAELLFILGLDPFLRVADLDDEQRRALVEAIPVLLRYAYEHGGVTRPGGAGPSRYERLHWVFRRGGRPCHVCGTPVRTDRRTTERVTFWCPTCQPEGTVTPRLHEPLPPVGHTRAR